MKPTPIKSKEEYSRKKSRQGLASQLETSPLSWPQGLEPIRIGLLREDYDEALRRALAERASELSRKLEILREWHGIEDGPDCWRRLCLAMARDKYVGFLEKAGRKPAKRIRGVLWMLAGERCRQNVIQQSRSCYSRLVSFPDGCHSWMANKNLKEG